MKRTFFAVVVCVFIGACEVDNQSQVTRLHARVAPPTLEITPGQHVLNLGATLFINRGFFWRDGYLYVPEGYRPREPIPLLVWLHGGGGDANEFVYMFPIADRFNVAILAIDARHNTWDGIDSPFGPDVEFIDKALTFTFQRLAVDAGKVALGGISDGGSYSLAIGRANGDLFTHIIAAAPWRLKPPSPPVGEPKILVVHGSNDNVYPVLHSRNMLVPSLRDEGYEVSYLEFAGPHWVPEPIVIKMFQWLRNEEVEQNPV